MFKYGETNRLVVGQRATVGYAGPKEGAVLNRRCKQKRALSLWHGRCSAGRKMFESGAVRSAEKARPNLGEVLEDALHQAKSLVQAELSLARSELVGELSHAYSALGFLAAGAILLQAGLATLGVLLVLALGVGIAAGAVVVAFLALGGALVFLAIRSFERKKFPRTTARLALDAKQVMETVK